MPRPCLVLQPGTLFKKIGQAARLNDEDGLSLEFFNLLQIVNSLEVDLCSGKHFGKTDRRGHLRRNLWFWMKVW